MYIPLFSSIHIFSPVCLSSIELLSSSITNLFLAFTIILTPLLHTSLLPELMQVYLVVPTTAVEPDFEQVVPGFTAAFDMPIGQQLPSGG